MIRLQLDVSPRPLMFVLTLAVLAMITASLTLQLVAAAYGADHIFGLLPLLNIDREANIPAWFSSFMLAFAALIAWNLGVHRQDDARDRGEIRGWRVVAGVLMLMSIDEGAQVHERVGDFIQPFLPDVGIFYFGWIAAALVGLIALAPLFVRFVRSLPPRAMVQITVAAIVFLMGAVGVEMITSTYMSAQENKLSMPYYLLSHAEELLEMVGVLLLIRAMLVRTEQSRDTVEGAAGRRRTGSPEAATALSHGGSEL